MKTTNSHGILTGTLNRNNIVKNPINSPTTLTTETTKGNLNCVKKRFNTWNHTVDQLWIPRTVRQKPKTTGRQTLREGGREGYPVQSSGPSWLRSRGSPTKKRGDGVHSRRKRPRGTTTYYVTWFTSLSHGV